MKTLIIGGGVVGLSLAYGLTKRNEDVVVVCGSVEVNQIKSQSRCGMGNCQGRYCGTTLAEIIANDSGDNSGKVSYFNIRMPIKPVSLKEIADLSAVK